MASRYFQNIGLYDGLALRQVWSANSDAAQHIEEFLHSTFKGRAFDLDEASLALAEISNTSTPGAPYAEQLFRAASTAPLSQTAFFANADGKLETLFSGHEGMGLDFMAHPPAAFLGHQLNVRAYHADRERVTFVRHWKNGSTELVYEPVPQDNCCELRLQLGDSAAGAPHSLVLHAGVDRVQEMFRGIGNRNRALLKTIKDFAAACGLS